MAAITIKNIPEALYEKLKLTATAHRRSINGELIHCLEKVLMPQKISIADRIQRARELRPPINQDAVTINEIKNAISSGRP